jgi:hypothetical protein
MDPRCCPFVCALALLLTSGCTAGPSEPPDTDPSDTGDTGDTGDTDAPGPFADLPRDRWTFVEDAEFACADGSPAGLGVWPGRSDELVVVLGGEGACGSGHGCLLHQWTLLRGGWGDAQMSSLARRLERAPLFDRQRPGNPLRDATWVMLPYCTGDLHTGTRTFEHTRDEPLNATQHHGHVNLERALGIIAGELPAPQQLWVVGIEAGGYGAQLHADLFARAWPAAALRILADNAPPVATGSWSGLRRTWAPPLPAGCAGCADNLPAWIPHRLAELPSARFGLLASTEHAWNLDLFNLRMGAYEPAVRDATLLYDRPGAQAWLIDGEHTSLLLAGDDLQSEGGVALQAWVDAWATPGTGDWAER